MFKLMAMWVSVVGTIYHAVPGQTDNTPNITATGFVIDVDDPLKHRIIAVSRDLEKIGFTMGTYVCVENAGTMNGVWVIRDRMNKRWKKRIDFLVPISIELGKWNNVDIRVVNRH
jgi:3D (Asp-Asp-Asp) domain-containing protein